MALKAELETASGGIARYVHIAGYRVLAKDRAVEAELFAYADKDARQAGKAPMLVIRDLAFTFAELGSEEPTRPALYKAVMVRAADMVEKAKAAREAIAAREHAAKNAKRIVKRNGTSEVIDFDETTVMGPVVASTAEQEVLESPLLMLAGAEEA